MIPFTYIVGHNMFAEEVPGLGIVVTVTTRFDPHRIRERLTYWLDKIANNMANEFRNEVNASGAYYPDENGRVKRISRAKAIDMGMKNLNWVVRNTEQKSSVMSEVKTYGMMVGKLILAYALPWVAIGLQISEMFGGKEKKPYPIPWDEIYSAALSPAKAYTNQEELMRIEAEKMRIEEEKQTEITKVSKAAAMFKLPEGVTSITKGGALVLNLQSQARTIEPQVVKEIKPVAIAIQKKPLIPTLPVVPQIQFR